MKTLIAVEGMTCGHCASHVKKALEDLDGVLQADVNLERKLATVDHDVAATVDAMLAAVVEEGYTATVVV